MKTEACKSTVLEMLTILKQLLSVEKTAQSAEHRIKVYQAFISKYDSLKPVSNNGTSVQSAAETFVSQETCDLQLDGFVSAVLVILLEDARCSTVDLSNAALLALAICLQQNCFTSRLSEEESTLILSALRDLMDPVNDRVQCRAAVFCVGVQDLDKACVRTHLPELLCSLQKCRQVLKTRAIEYDSLTAVAKLLTQVREEMISMSVSWVRLVYPLMVHSNLRIRESAIALLQSCVSEMSAQPSTASNLLEDLGITASRSDGSNSLIADLERMMLNGDLQQHAMIICSLLMRLLGTDFHKSSVCQKFLTVIEAGFKSSNVEVKLEAYRAWRVLIDNFALDPDVLCKASRVKLIMQVFRRSSVRVELIESEKLRTWWHFVCRLGEKAIPVFDQVVVQFLQVNIQGGADDTKVLLTTPKTPTIMKLDYGEGLLAARAHLA